MRPDESRRGREGVLEGAPERRRRGRERFGRPEPPRDAPRARVVHARPLTRGGGGSVDGRRRGDVNRRGRGVKESREARPRARRRVELPGAAVLEEREPRGREELLPSRARARAEQKDASGDVDAIASAREVEGEARVGGTEAARRGEHGPRQGSGQARRRRRRVVVRRGHGVHGCVFRRRRVRRVLYTGPHTTAFAW